MSGTDIINAIMNGQAGPEPKAVLLLSPARPARAATVPMAPKKAARPKAVRADDADDGAPSTKRRLVMPESKSSKAAVVHVDENGKVLIKKAKATKATKMANKAKGAAASAAVAADDGGRYAAARQQRPGESAEEYAKRLKRNESARRYLAKKKAEEGGSKKAALKSKSGAKKAVPKAKDGASAAMDIDAGDGSEVKAKSSSSKKKTEAEADAEVVGAHPKLMAAHDKAVALWETLTKRRDPVLRYLRALAFTDLFQAVVTNEATVKRFQKACEKGEDGTERFLAVVDFFESVAKKMTKGAYVPDEDLIEAIETDDDDGEDADADTDADSSDDGDEDGDDDGDDDDDNDADDE